MNEWQLKHQLLLTNWLCKVGQVQNIRDQIFQFKLIQKSNIKICNKSYMRIKRSFRSIKIAFKYLKKTIQNKSMRIGI